MNGRATGLLLVDGICSELVGGPVDRGVPRPPALDGTSWSSVQVEMNSGGKLGVRCASGEVRNTNLLCGP